MQIDLGEDEAPEISLVALIDCVFFLLLFFMVTTTFKRVEEQQALRSIPLQLPQAEISFDRSEAVEAELVIAIDAQGAVYLDGQPTGIESFNQRLRTLAQQRPTAHIRIDADRAASYPSVIRVLDRCALEGLRNVALRVDHAP